MIMKPNLFFSFSFFILLFLTGVCRSDISQIVKERANVKIENVIETKRDSSKIIREHSLKSPQICVYYLNASQENVNFFVDDGDIYADDRLLGQTERGCVIIPKEKCSKSSYLIFKPNSIKAFHFNITSKKPENFCDDITIKLSEDHVKNIQLLNWTIPYVKNIVKDDPSLRKTAKKIVKHCKNISCKVNAIYRYVISTLHYINDPEGTEVIYSPFETINQGGGDCEDLTGVLISFLEQVGVKTYIVLAENHAYSLACGVEMKLLKNAVLESFYREKVIPYYNSFSLNPRAVFYYGGQNKSNPKTVEFSFYVSASHPIDVYLVGSKKDHQLYLDGEEFDNFPECKGIGVKYHERTCNITDSGGIILDNNGRKDTSVLLGIIYRYSYYYIDIKEISINFYSVENQTCVVLEATAGKTGYPGFSKQDMTKKIAVDPRTYEIVWLDAGKPVIE